MSERQLGTCLNGDEQDIKCRGLLRRGERLPLTLQLGHLHPFSVEEVETLHLPDRHQEDVPMPIFDGLIVDAPQVVRA